MVGGLTATGMGGAGAGTVTLGQYASIVFDDTQTIDNATVTLGGYDGSLDIYTSYAAYVAAGYQSTAQTLTLGPNLTVDETASYGTIGNQGGYGTGSIVNDGTIDAAATNGQMTINPTGFTNVGVVNVSGGDTLAVNSASITNDGTIAIESGALSLQSMAGGTGVVTIGAGASAAFLGGSSASQTVAFLGGSGNLTLQNSASFLGQVSGMTGQDSIDLRDISFTSAGEATFSGTSAGGVLTVSDGVHVTHLNLVGDYTHSSFVAASDNQGGTRVVDPVLLPAVPPVLPPHQPGQ